CSRPSWSLAGSWWRRWTRIRRARPVTSASGRRPDSMTKQRYNFMRYGKTTLAVSAVLVVLSLLSLGVRGLNLGIDFTGGTLIERELARPVTADDVRAVLTRSSLADLDLNNAVIQPLDDP